MLSPALEWLTVTLLGALVGIGELVSRYRDAPDRALRTVPAVFYIGVNIAASVAALYLVRVFGWSFGVDGTKNPAVLEWTQVLVAGFGAMALFRSSLFTVRAGDRDIAVGPSSFLQVILSAADRAVDRLRAQARTATVTEIMKGVSYAKAKTALPTYCLALMQNLAEEDQQKLGSALKSLDSFQGIDDHLKILILGLTLMNVVGPDVLTAAVRSLGAEIREAAPH